MNLAIFKVDNDVAIQLCWKSRDRVQCFVLTSPVAPTHVENLLRFVHGQGQKMLTKSYYKEVYLAS